MDHVSFPDVWLLSLSQMSWVSLNSWLYTKSSTYCKGYLIIKFRNKNDEKKTWQNQRAPDTLRAAQGGMCPIIRTVLCGHSWQLCRCPPLHWVTYAHNAVSDAATVFTDSLASWSRGKRVGEVLILLAVILGIWNPCLLCDSCLGLTSCMSLPFPSDYGKMMDGSLLDGTC